MARTPLRSPSVRRSNSRRHSSATLHVVCAYRPHNARHTRICPRSSPSAVQPDSQVQAVLDDVFARARQAGVKAEPHAVTGDAADAIIDLGRRGRRGAHRHRQQGHQLGAPLCPGERSEQGGPPRTVLDVRGPDLLIGEEPRRRRPRGSLTRGLRLIRHRSTIGDPLHRSPAHRIEDTPRIVDRCRRCAPGLPPRSAAPRAPHPVRRSGATARSSGPA